MKKYDNYPPLELLKSVTKQFPKAWEQMKMFHESNGQSGIAWPEWCYAPMAAAMAVATKGQDIYFLSENEQIMGVVFGQCISALAPWRLNKEVFVIDKDLEVLLFDQHNELEVPTEALINIPYPSFYVQFNNLFFGDKKIHGVFVHLEFDINNDDRELRYLFLQEDGVTFGAPIHIGSENILTSLQETIKQGVENSKGMFYEDVARQLSKAKKQQNEFAEFLGKVTQAILYLCASNADIEPNEEQKTTYQKRTKTSVVKDRYAEIRKWDIGVRVGSAVRKYKKQNIQTSVNDEDINEEKTIKTHSSPRPHIRRGHWHNFWTGQRSVPEKRKLVLKWVAPIYIGKALEDSPVVIHKVTSK